MGNAFSTFHPAVPALWFTLVLAGTVASFHPLLLCLALVACWVWWGRLGGRPGFAVLLPLLILAALLNPLFSHAGVTILAYFPNGNPLTLESIWFGLGAALMLAAALACLGCMSQVMTADRWMCLLGRAAPILSLLLSMILGALPRLRQRLAQVSAAQRQVGRRGKTRLERARLGLRELGVVLAWSMEDALVRADSMEGRGYGLPGRTSYTNFRLTGRDRQMLGLLGLLGGYLLLMGLQGALAWRYYPSVKWGGLSLWSLSGYLDWAILCALPLYLDWKEGQKWRAWT